MPHTSRKKRNQFEHYKLVQVEDSDGWTHVVKSKAPIPEEWPQHLEHPLPAEAPDGESLDKVKSAFEKHRTLWLQSSCWNSVRDILKEGISRNEVKISNCVCIALGSPTGLSRHGSVDRRTTSMNQIAALAAILDLLRMYLRISVGLGSSCNIPCRKFDQQQLSCIRSRSCFQRS
jgi:hypothetical protein